MINNFLIGLSTSAQQAIIIIIAIWSIVWKGLALWRSSKKDQKYWFIALLVLNTIGLLEIAYIVYFSKLKKKKKGK